MLINLLFLYAINSLTNNCQYSNVSSYYHASYQIDGKNFSDKNKNKSNKKYDGKASWYDYEYQGEAVSTKKLVAASTTFRRGTKVIVRNKENNKVVLVTITDYGPDPIQHPDRIIDLGSLAFSKIANLNKGIINVEVEEYNN